MKLLSEDHNFSNLIGAEDCKMLLGSKPGRSYYCYSGPDYGYTLNLHNIEIDADNKIIRLLNHKDEEVAGQLVLKGMSGKAPDITCIDMAIDLQREGIYVEVDTHLELSDFVIRGV